LSPRCTSFPPTRSRQTSGTPTPPYFPLGHLAPASHVTCRPRQTKHTTMNEQNASLLTKHYSLPTSDLSSRLGLGKPRYLNPYLIAAFKPHLPKKMRSNYSLCDGKKYLCVWLPKMVLNQYIQRYIYTVHPTLQTTYIYTVHLTLYILCNTSTIFYSYNCIYILNYLRSPPSCMRRMSVVCAPAMQCTFYLTGETYHTYNMTTGYYLQSQTS
jgi:hypothetical protein